MCPTVLPHEVPQKPAEDAPDTPPEGMWFENLAGGKMPFRARWRLKGKKLSRTFASAKDRAEFAAAWAKRKREQGKAAVSIHPRRVAVWDEFDRITDGADPIEVARFYARLRGIAGGQLSVPEGVQRFWEIYMAGKSFAGDTISHRKLHLRRFAGTFASKRLNEILPADVRLWLFGNPEKKQRPLLVNRERADGVFSPTSQLHHLRSVSLMFDVLKRERLVEYNPCEAVEEPTIPEKDRTILTPRQAFDLFRVNSELPVTGPLAVEAFGGLRFTSAARLTLEHIKGTLRGLEMPAPLHKTRKRKFRQGHPLNLWTWVDAAPAESWGYVLSTYNLAKRAAFVRARLKPPVSESVEEREKIRGMRNVLRYSFASYLMALTNNGPLVARLMQHKHTSTTEIYEGVATREDAVLYFSITRAAVQLPWAKFTAKAAKKTAEALMPA